MQAGVKRKSKSVPAWHFFLSGTGAKGAKDAVSGRGGDVSATGNVPEMSWAPVPWLPCFKSVFVVSQTREEEFKQRP